MCSWEKGEENELRKRGHASDNTGCSVRQFGPLE